MKEREEGFADVIRAGDAASIEQAYEAYFTPVINFVYYMIYDYDAACDISQEAFLRTVEACKDKRKSVRDFKSYLFGTARNLAMDHLRRAKKFADVPETTLTFEDPNIFADPARAALLTEQRASVAKAAMRLNEHQRVALMLRDIEGWSYNDIGDFMGLSRTAVGVLLSRARLKFKKEFRLQEIDAGRLERGCADLLPLMSAVLDGEATDTEKEIVQEHLRTCPICRETMDDMAGASRTLRAMVPLLPALSVKTALLAQVTAAGLATGAAAVAVGGGMSAVTKAVIGVVASIIVAGAGVGTYVGIRSAPPPTAKVIKPLDGVSLTIDMRADGTGIVPVAISVDNEPAAVEVEIDGKTVKRFDRGPYSFDWITAAQGSHTVKPTAFDASGKAHTGTSVTFSLVIKAGMTERISFLRGGDVFSIGLDGAGESQVTSTGTAENFATSPANGRIAFIDRAGVMYLLNHDGGGMRQVTLPERGKAGSAAFSRDGKYIYFSREVKLAGDTDYSSHVRFDRYDIAANTVDVIYTIPEAFQDETIGGVFTDASGDYLYYNHFGSDFPSSEVHRISLKGPASDTLFMPTRTDVPGTDLVRYMMWSLSADGSHVSYQRQAVMDREPPPGSRLGTSIEVGACIRPTNGGDEKTLETVDLASPGPEAAISRVEFSGVEPSRCYYTKRSRPEGGGSYSYVMFTGTLEGEPVATGLSAGGWDEWHVLAVPQG